MLAQAVDIEKNPREVHFWDILRIKDSHPEAFKQWNESMEAEIKSLNDQKVQELVDLPPNQKPIM